MRNCLVAFVLMLPLAARGKTPAPRPRPAAAFVQDQELLIRQIRESMRGLRKAAPDEAGSRIIGIYVRAESASAASELNAARRDYDAWVLRFRASVAHAAPAPAPPSGAEARALELALKNQRTAAARVGTITIITRGDPRWLDSGAYGVGEAAAPPRRAPVVSPPGPAASGDERLRAKLISVGADPGVLGGIARAAGREGVDPLVLLAMSRRETNLRRQEKCLMSRAKEPAVGSLQIKPTTARDYGDYDARDLCDLETNVSVAARHLKKISNVSLSHIDHFDDRVRQAIASYYAGAGTISKGMKGKLTGYWEIYNWRHAWDVYVPAIEGYFNEMRAWKKPGVV